MFFGWSSLRMTSRTVVLRERENDEGGGGARASEAVAAEEEEEEVAAAATFAPLPPLPPLPLPSTVADSGVYPATRKWHIGVGTRLATSPTRSLFMYPGNRSVAEALAITAAASALALPSCEMLLLLFKLPLLDNEE